MESPESHAIIQAVQVSGKHSIYIHPADRSDSPLMRISLKNKILCRFYTSLVNEALEAENYDARTAGLGYAFSKGLESLNLQVTGYNDKLLVLMFKVVKVMRNIQIDKVRFDLKKEALLKDLDNETYLSPLKRINAEWTWLTSHHGASTDEERSVIECKAFRGRLGAFLPADVPARHSAITAENLQAFIPELLCKAYLECLGHGNFDKIVSTAG